ncbi:MAG: DUF885 domain-containing protein [Actinomycetaceae bacterium]|nr:DUF885 domain-containing protein [Actinomycetaceae bacterium]
MRKVSALDRVTDEFVDGLLDHVPELAIDMGVPLRENTISDFSPEGAQELRALYEQALTRAEQVEDEDSVDAVTRKAFTWDLQNHVELDEAGLLVGVLNNIGSPVQMIRDPFTLMPTDTQAQWEDIVRRVSEVPKGYSTYMRGLEWAVKNGHAPSRVQTEFALRDLAAQGGSQDPYARLLKEFDSSEVAEQEALRARLEEAVAGAQKATGEFRAWLKDEIAPVATNRDAVGRENYILLSANFLGKKINPEETYEWALEELRGIHERQQAIVSDLYGEGVTVAEAFERLNNDPDHQVHGTVNLTRWMQQTSDEAVEYLADRHFTVTDEMRRLSAMISPAGDGGIFYTPPTDDFSRPGTMWWAVPPGVEVFHTWQEKTTVYHEGMPGHHMQLARAVSMKDSLNTWRRQLCWFSGHGEGWALYAEELMDELGFLRHPAEQLGMLDAQRLRAARVLVDIGLHLGLQKPSPAYLASIGISEDAFKAALETSPYVSLGEPEVGPGVWDRNDLWAFMNLNVAMNPKFLEFETTRYLGWAGQASSYKVGQRVWQELRADWVAKHQAGATASAGLPDESVLREFHDTALALGGLPLEVLEDVMRNA